MRLDLEPAVRLRPIAGEISPEQELARVLDEIAGALNCVGAALTLHPVARAAQIIYAGPEGAFENHLTGLIDAGALDWGGTHPDNHIWVPGALGGFAGHAIALPVRRVPGHSRLVITGFFDTLDDERRAAAEAAFMARRPFAVGYFRLWQEERLRQREVHALRNALDRVDMAIMLIAKSGAIGFANEAARKILEAGEGLYEQRRELRARDRSDAITLALAIDEVLDACERPDKPIKLQLLTIQRVNSAPLVLAILPVQESAAEEGEIACLVIVVDRDMEIEERAALICKLFGLTRVETKLACALAMGHSIQEAAEQLHIKAETARSYLKAIFGKTGVNRQIDLVRLILVSLVRAGPLRDRKTQSRPESSAASASADGESHV